MSVAFGTTNHLEITIVDHLPGILSVIQGVLPYANLIGSCS